MSMCIAMPAGAVGDAQLSQRIISNPIPGYQPISDAVLQSQVDYLNQLERSAIGPAGGTAAIAANGWRDPSTKTGVAIILVAFAIPHASDADIQKNAAAAGLSFCAAGTAASPVSNSPISGIPNSHLIKCQASPTGGHAMVATWMKANVLGMIVTSLSSMSPARLASVATEQFNAMSSTNTKTGGGTSTALIIGLAVAGVVLVSVIVVVVVVIRARKRSEADALQQASDGLGPEGPEVPVGASFGDGESSPQAGPPAGWYEDPEDSSARRYWTGAAWGPAADQGESTSQVPTSPLEGDAQS